MITVKSYEESDREWLQSLLDKDEVHKVNGLTIDDATEVGTKGVVIGDETGPLMFLRCHTALRIGFQFDVDHKYRTAKAMPEIVQWMQGAAKSLGAKELIALPGSEKASKFAARFKFKDFIGKVMRVF